MFFFEPLGLIVLVPTITTVLLRKIWLTAIVVALLIAIFSLNISTWIDADDITNFAISEGCITAPVPTTTSLIALMAIISMTTWRTSRRRKPAA
ncbi:MAG: hypothetical protein AAGG57_07540 [Pseudomonadota bacterium]